MNSFIRVIGERICQVVRRESIILGGETGLDTNQARVNPIGIRDHIACVRCTGETGEVLP